MPTCRVRHRARHGAQKARGYTYLGLLLVLVLLGAGLARLGTAWATAAQREQERELRFRGAQIAAAITHYRAARQPAEWPPNLQALLQDTRDGAPRHHLRRLFADPCTGRADWVLLPGPEGVGVAGVRSRADTPRLNTQIAGAAGDPRWPRGSDWHFVVEAHDPEQPDKPDRPEEAPEPTPQEDRK